MKYELKEEDIVRLGNYRGKNIQMALPDKEDYITRCIRNSNALYQEELLNSLLKLIPVNPTVIDVGSFTGSSAIWFSTIASAKRVIAIEPDEYFYSILDTNIKLSGLKDSVDTVQAAVGHTDGTANLKVTTVTNLGATQYRIAEGNTGTTPVVSIDSLLSGDKNKVDVIHLAMEGNEYLAIQGARETIIRDKPIIIIALWGPTTTCVDPEYDCLFGYTKLIGELVKLGYVTEGRHNEKVVFIPNPSHETAK